MAGQFLETYFTPGCSPPRRTIRRPQVIPPQADRDPLGAEEVEFYRASRQFYMATVTSTGWPYVQHRGGPTGFLKVLDPQDAGLCRFSEATDSF